MKVFKKTALLLTVIVLAVVLSIGVIAGVAHAAEGTATLGEICSGVQVTTDGKVNLKFFYSDLGSATGFKVELVEPVSGTTELINATVETVDNTTVVRVPLSPSQMTHTVKVTATNGDADGSTVEYSVAEYAQAVLADANEAKHHDAMRMLLNWGAMAQVHFEDATDALANVNVFARSTNPVDAVTAASTGVADRGEGDELFQSSNVLLAPNNTAMSIIVNLGNISPENVTASYTRDNDSTVRELDLVPVSGTTYKVTINNISVKNWGAVYTITLNDGTTNYSYSYSLLNYFTYQIANGEKAVQDVVKSMFQFYQAVSGNVDANCAHDASLMHWNNNGENATLACSICLKELGITAPNSAEYVINPWTIAKQTNDTVTTEVMNNAEDGAFARITRVGINKDGYSYFNMMSGNKKYLRYIVMKVRYGADNGLGQTTAKVYTAIAEGAVNAFLYPISEDGEWHTIVIDTQVPESHIHGQLHFRLFNGNDSTWIKDGTDPDTGKNYGHYELKGDGDEYVDIAYVGFTDDLAEATALVDTAEYEFDYGDGTGAVINAETGACIKHNNCKTSTTTNEDGATVYTAQCAVCDTVAATQVVPKEINYFATLSNMNVFATTGKITKNVVEDGILFNRYTTTGGCHLNITGDGGAGAPTTGKYPTGKYVTFKYRVENGTYISLNIATGDKKDGNGAGNGEQAAANTPQGFWRVAIVDVSGNPEWTSDGSEQQIYTMWTVGADVIDVAYFAVVDSIDEAILLMGEEDEYIYDYGTSFANTPIPKDKNGECAHTVPTYVVDESDARGYKYVCGYCNADMKVEYFNNTLVGSYNTGDKKYGATITGKSADGFTYKNVDVYGTGGTMISFVGNRFGQQSNYTAHSVYAGRYLVVKIRGTVPEGGKLPFCVATEDSGLDSGNNPIQVSIGDLTSANMPSEWTVLVIDLSGVSKYNVGTNQKVAFTTATGSGGMATYGVNFDLAYVAIADELADIQSIVTDETFRLYKGSVSKDYYEMNTETLACVGGCESYVYVADESAEHGYKYACAACGSVVSDTVNWYRDTFSSGYNSTATKHEGYTTFTFSGSGHLNLSYDGADGRGGLCSKEQVVAGKYLAIKIRAELSGELEIRIGNTDEYQANNWNHKMTIVGSLGVGDASADEWRIVIVNLESYNSDVYEIGKKHGILLSTQGASAAGVTLDVAWIAMGDTVDELKPFFGTDDTTYFDFGGSYSNTPVEKNKSDDKCVVHGMDIQNINDNYVYACAGCGLVSYDYNIKPSAANMFYWLKDAATWGSMNGSMDRTVMVEDGISFVRIDNNKVNASKWSGWHIFNNASGITGNYFVVKLRVGENGLGQSYINFYISTTGVSWDKAPYSVKVSEDGEWHTIVVDLSARNSSSFVKGDDGLYHPHTVLVRPFEGVMEKASGDNYVDISYFTFCDSMEDVSALVGTDTYEWSISASSSIERKSNDHTCATEHIVTEAVNGNTYSYTCADDGDTVSVTVPESVTKYYSPVGFGTTAAQYYATGKSCPIYTEDGVAFTRSTKNAQILWARVAADFTGGGQTNLEKTYDVGNANYFVIKVRYSNNATSSFNMTLSTTAKNGTPDSNGDGKVETNGYKNVNILNKEQADGEWHTYVIDLNAIFGEYYGKDATTGTYVLDTLYFNMSNVAELDISYMAFVEGDWADIAELTGEATVRQLTGSGTYKNVSTADGSDAQ